MSQAIKQKQNNNAPTTKLTKATNTKQQNPKIQSNHQTTVTKSTQSKISPNKPKHKVPKPRKTHKSPNT